MYCICSHLAAGSNAQICHRYIEFLKTDKIASEYNWAGFFKDKLIAGIKATHKKMVANNMKSARPSGDTHALIDPTKEMSRSKEWYDSEITRLLDEAHILREEPDEKHKET
ncbi:uncharacterized protein LOC127253106 [Andrographis paniculata]|uniref:uncharacterized protein LOC127253106 n=1 Tax=Andrographis paniculata TaxID=175694 RepID=UPI0021E9581B|nr:uncharacterized protein LOC127253106 [Andrographis paniculata]